MELYTWILLIESRIQWHYTSDPASKKAYWERVDVLFCLLACSSQHPCSSPLLRFVLDATPNQLREFLKQYKYGAMQWSISH